jgi:hypothetical protein
MPDSGTSSGVSISNHLVFGNETDKVELMSGRLIVLELNEVPYRVIDAYCAERPSSNLARLVSKSVQYNTFTEDRLALDPWISWPTFHRGVHDETHQILHLGQVIDEVDSKFPPIWRILRERALTVGVFGSLHSSAIPSDVGSYSFYVPDYFGADAFAHPSELLPFQRLNLAMTRQSARNVTRKVPAAALTHFLATAPFAGLTLGTALDSAGHLVRETFNRSLRIRRRAYQPLVMADLFIRQLENTLPSFATFYTNHVAAAMHRYWGAAFPQDYAQPLDSGWISQYCHEITFSMDKLDSIIGRLMKFTQDHPDYVLLVGSSMGQAAIPAEKTFQFLTITDMGRFLAQFGVPANGWDSRPAMVPCQSVVIREEYRKQVIDGISRLQIGDAKFKEDKRPVHPMSYEERERGFFQFFIQFDGHSGAGRAEIGDRSVPISEIGLGLMAHEDGVNCTAQHVPEGCLLAYDGDSSHDTKRRRETISTLDVAPSIMRFFGLEPPSYMRGTASVAIGS